MAVLTVRDIVESVSQDVRKVLAESGTDQEILIDFTNRTHLAFVRYAEWDWLLSVPQRFITKLGQTQYFIATGTATTGTVQTNLAIADLDYIKGDTVYNRSMTDGSAYPLYHVKDATPNLTTWFTQDYQARSSPPKIWFHQDENPNIIHIYPAPDNQNSYQPVPLPPNFETSTAGALSARTYFIKITLVDSAGGESAASAPSVRAFVPVNKVLVVKSPALPLSGMSSGITYSQYKVYASTTENAETLQTASAVNIGTDWTEPVSGLIAGAAFPTTTTLEPMRGYIIEFRYVQTPKQLATMSDELQVPAAFRDVMIAGVNAMAFQYLQKSNEASVWYNLYRNGLKEVVGSKYPFGTDYVRPGRNP